MIEPPVRELAGQQKAGGGPGKVSDRLVDGG
jgi:hypothetical protein